MPSLPVTWSLAPSIINYRTNAIYEIGRPLRAEGATRATWTSADPPSGWLAGLSGDDPVLGGRLGRGHRAAQPATAIAPRPPPHPVLLLLAIGDMRCGRPPSSERASWRRSRWRRRSPAGRWSRPLAEPRRVTSPPRPAGGSARAPTSCSALVAGRWPTGSGSSRLPPSLGHSHRRNPTSIVVNRRPRPQGRVRGRRAGFAASAAATPRGRRPRNPVHPRLRRTWRRSLAPMTGLRNGTRVSQRR